MPRRNTSPFWIPVIRITLDIRYIPYYYKDMANVLNTDKKIAVISALAEGSGIRQIERMTGVHRDTIMRLGVRVGEGCANLLDHKMRNLSCQHLQFDELWGFIGKKQKHVMPEDDPTCVEVFELVGHPKAARVYAWSH